MTSQRLRILFIVIVFISFNFLRSSWAHVSQSSWYAYYQPIEDNRAAYHLQNALAYMSVNVGDPVQTVKKVRLCLSRPVNPKLYLKQNFQLTEINDLYEGEYTIYLRHRPADYAFWGQMIHEVSHLLDPRIHDAYFEGFSTLMAEKYLEKEGLDWQRWSKYFKAGQEPFYGQTYFMMRDILEAAGDGAMRNFHTFVRPLADDKSKYRIDINRWLKNLPLGTQREVKKIILKYAPEIRRSMEREHLDVAFVLPDGGVSN